MKLKSINVGLLCLALAGSTYVVFAQCSSRQLYCCDAPPDGTDGQAYLQYCRTCYLGGNGTWSECSENPGCGPGRVACANRPC